MTLDELLTRLRRSSDRTCAALAALEALAQRASGSVSTAGGELRRCTLHLRVGDAYREMMVFPEQRERPDPESSATAWRLVAEQGGGVLLDVETERWSPLASAYDASVAPRFGWAGRTRVQLQSRRTTHLAALPLRGPGDGLAGMATIELDCPRAVGTRLDALHPIARELQSILDVAGPVVLSRTPAARPAEPADPLLPVIGRAMAPVVDTLRAFSAFDQTILLRGPTGTGKSHLARWCHSQSPRRAGPFVVTQMHAVSEHLREADLFGWRRGAFTGANADHRGRVTQATGGTLFLDEIDKLDLGAQGKLLRLLEERQYTVLGEERDRHADVRFVVGTNADLRREVDAGRFLEDLYFRVHVLPVEVPPLSERRDEIPAWAAHMLESARGAVSAAFAAGASEALAAYAWPGNLRQLHSVVVRALALSAMSTAAGGLLVDAQHVFRALAMEAGTRSEAPLIATVQAAAESFVREAERVRVTTGTPLDLELTAALRGAVLREAVRVHGGPREAFQRLGLAGQLVGGNHLRRLRREQERLEALCAALGQPLPAAWREPEE